MRAKKGVDLSTLREEISRLELIIDDVYSEFGAEAMVTSANDGKHRADSLHYRDAAIDLRVKSVGGAKMQTMLHALLARVIDEAYPGMYDVLLEYPGEENAHIHLEFSPFLVALVFGKANLGGQV